MHSCILKFQLAYLKAQLALWQSVIPEAEPKAGPLENSSMNVHTVVRYSTAVASFSNYSCAYMHVTLCMGSVLENRLCRTKFSISKDS